MKHSRNIEVTTDKNVRKCGPHAYKKSADACGHTLVLASTKRVIMITNEVLNKLSAPSFGEAVRPERGLAIKAYREL